MDEKGLWNELLEYARWAPSPHNVQPWKVKILSEKEAEVYYDPKRLLSVEDDTGKFTIAGFGIFIEMLSLAAHKSGFTVAEEYNGTLLDASKTELTLFAKIKLIKTQEKEPFDRELIVKRRTSRLPYDGRPIPEAVVQELKDIAKKYGHTFTFSNEEDMIKWILQLNCDTVFYDLKDTATREEIGYWLRCFANEARSKKDGLWAYCMTMPGMLMYLFFHLHFFFDIPFIKSFAKSYYLKSTAGTKTVGWLTGAFSNPSDWINAGHMLARLWLCLTKHNLYLHPFGSTITNKDSHKRLREKFNVDEGKEEMWLIVRMGYSETPPRSLRLSVSDILL